MSNDQTVEWLRELAKKGGKGVVNNIDARCLGRIADELERLRAPAQAVPDLREELIVRAENYLANNAAESGADALIRELINALSAPAQAAPEPQTLGGMIAAIYGELDAEDCNMIDREWIKWRGAGTIAFALSSPDLPQTPGKPLTFMDVMDIVHSGYDTWKNKPYNAKWFKRIDDTPIPNDLLVNVAEAICHALTAPPTRSSEGTVDALKEAERFMAYFSGETDGVFAGPGTPTKCLEKIRAALALSRPVECRRASTNPA